MKPFVIAGALVVATCNGSAFAQDVLDDQKKQAEIDKLRAETEKARADRDKVLIETDKTVLDPLRNFTGGTAAVTGPEKTAEAALVNRAALAGASAKLASALRRAGVVPSPSVVPLVVIGSTPPAAVNWAAFKDRRDAVADHLKQANRAWDKAAAAPPTPGTGGVLKYLGAVTTALTVASTVLPMLKTETTIVGGDVVVDTPELASLTQAALRAEGYGLDYSPFEIVDPSSAADELVAPLAQDYAEAKVNLRTFNDGVQSTRRKAAADVLKTVIGQYDDLRADLLKPTNAGVPALIIRRESQDLSGLTSRPIIYIVKSRMALTSTTRKGFFTGLGGSVPAFLSSTALLDYVIVGPAGARAHGTVACTLSRIRVTDAATLDPETLTARRDSLCLAPASASSQRDAS